MHQSRLRIKSRKTGIRGRKCPSAGLVCFPMQESSSSEVEKVLLFISDARERTKKARVHLSAGEPDQHVIEALDRAERALGAAHRELMQGTYFAVPERNEQLAV